MSVYKTRWFDRWARKEGLAMSAQAVTTAAQAGELIEVDCDAQD